MRRVAPVLALAACLLLALSCGDEKKDEEDNPAGPVGYQTPDMPTSPGQLIVDYLPTVYSQMDSAGYAAIFDESYRFELLRTDPDPSVPAPWWDLAEEMAIAGNIFSGRENDEGQKVDRITLEMTVKTNVVDNTPYPNKPEGETWHKVTAFVDLLVVVEDPRDSEGVMYYIVNSDQIFVVRPDPAGGEAWIVYKQVDQEPINKRPVSPGTAASSWGAVKEMFR